MLRKLVALIAFGTIANAFAQTAVTVPSFADVKVKITQGGKPLYTGKVLVPRNQEVVKDAITLIVPKTKCEPNHSVNISQVDFRNGFRVAITATPSLAKSVVINADYFVAIAENKGFKPFLVGCESEEIVLNSVFKTATSFILRSGETNTLDGNGIEIQTSILGIYNAAPEGNTPGVFYNLD